MSDRTLTEGDPRGVFYDLFEEEDAAELGLRAQMDHAVLYELWQRHRVEDDSGPEWITLSSLLMRCAADEETGAKNVAEALGRLHERGYIETLHEPGRFNVRLRPSAMGNLKRLPGPPPTLGDLSGPDGD